MAVGQFDLGPAAAFSLVYFLIILLVSWLFYTAMTHSDANCTVSVWEGFQATINNIVASQTLIRENSARA